MRYKGVSLKNEHLFEIDFFQILRDRKLNNIFGED